MRLSDNVQLKKDILAYQLLSLLLILQCNTIMMVPFRSCVFSKSWELHLDCIANKHVKSKTIPDSAMLAERAQKSPKREGKKLETTRRATVTIWKHLKENHCMKLGLSRTLTLIAIFSHVIF